MDQDTSWHLEEASDSVLEQISASCKCPFSSISLSPDTGTIFVVSSSGGQNSVKKIIFQVNMLATIFFSHHRWKNLGGGKIVRTPGLEFPDGYHIQIRHSG